MGFRVPVLEYFPWQPMVLAINIKNINEAEPKKGNRYLISDTPDSNDELLADKANCIMYYGDNETWFFDKPQDSWTITYKEHIPKVNKTTNEVILDENDNIVYIDLYHILYYSESENKWKDWTENFSQIKTNYDVDLGCFIFDA